MTIDEDPRRSSATVASLAAKKQREGEGSSPSSPSKPNSVSSSPGKKRAITEQGAGLGLPKNMYDGAGETKRTMRRVSDLFAETMGEFDTFSLGNGGSDLSF